MKTNYKWFVFPASMSLVSGDGKPEGGRDAMARLLDLDPQPTAVFCYNDMSALGAMRAIHARGLIVPDDISIIGFDDLFLASYANPLLTAIRQPMRQMGRLAMETVLKIISGDRSTSNIKVQGELIVRESTSQIKEASHANSDVAGALLVAGVCSLHEPLFTRPSSRGVRKSRRHCYMASALAFAFDLDGSPYDGSSG